MYAKLKLRGPWFALLCLSACGGSESETKISYPEPAALRSFYGLQPGSCYRYTYLDGDLRRYMTERVTGPETLPNGSKVYQRERRYDAGGLSEISAFDTNTEPGKIRLMRRFAGRSSAERQIIDYDAAPPTVFGLRYNLRGKLELIDSNRFSTVVTPKICKTGDQYPNCPNGEAEQHDWILLSENQKVSVPGSKDDDSVVSAAEAGGGSSSTKEVEAYRFQYRHRVGSSDETQSFSLVPNAGPALMVEGSVSYRVCAWRVCDEDGSCKGASSCDALRCADE